MAQLVCEIGGLNLAFADAQWGGRVKTDLLLMCSVLETLTRTRALPRAGGPADPPGPNGPEHEGGEDIDLEDAPVSATPRRYKVIFHNDDYTTMEFVVEVLRRYFHKTETEALHIMLTVHKTGAAVAAVYTRDVAETKAAEVMEYARENGMPLMITTEPE